jgi:hypothetical protein
MVDYHQRLLKGEGARRHWRQSQTLPACHPHYRAAAVAYSKQMADAKFVAIET